MFNKFQVVYAICLLAGLSSMIGCGESGPNMSPVEGTVTMDGKPLDKVMVEFWPESPGPRSFAETDANGHFKLMSDDGKHEGAVVSTHKVVLKDSKVYEGMPLGRKAENYTGPAGNKPRFGAKFTQSQTTPISKVVEAAKKNEFTLEVTK